MGTYTIQETAAPSGWALDTHTATVTLDLSNLPTSANPDAGTFVDVRLFRLIVITWSENGPTIIPSTVTLSGRNPATRDTISTVPANLAVLGVTDADIGNIGAGSGNANYGMLDAGTYNPSVLIPKP